MNWFSRAHLIAGALVHCTTCTTHCYVTDRNHIRIRYAQQDRPCSWEKDVTAPTIKMKTPYSIVLSIPNAFQPSVSNINNNNNNNNLLFIHTLYNFTNSQRCEPCHLYELSQRSSLWHDLIHTLLSAKVIIISNCRLVPYWREFLGVSWSRTRSDLPCKC